jgi:hypothetical protein
MHGATINIKIRVLEKRCGVCGLIRLRKMCSGGFDYETSVTLVTFSFTDNVGKMCYVSHNRR